MALPDIPSNSGNDAARPTAGTMKVRSAGGGDWAAIWRIMSVVTRAGDTFTYPLDLPESEARTLWMTNNGQTIVAVDEAERVIGTAKMGANQMGPGSHVATGSVMVAPSARGQGVGRMLGKAIIEWAEAGGFRSIQFNAVVSANLVAVGLWESLGFEIVGTVPEAFAHPTEGLVALHIMHRRL